MRKKISIKFDSYRREKGDDPLCLSVIYLQFISFFSVSTFSICSLRKIRDESENKTNTYTSQVYTANEVI